MKFPKISFSQIGEKLQTAIKRFPLTIAAILTLAGFVAVNIHYNKADFIDQRIWIFLPLVIFSSLAFYLFAENRISCLIKNGLNIVLIVLIAWFSLSLAKSPVVNSEIIRTVAICISLGLAVFFAPYITGKQPVKFWNYVIDTFFHLVLSYFFAAILMGGLSLALISLNKLFAIFTPDKYYAYLATMCFIVFAPIYFLSLLSKENPADEETEVEFPKFLKIFGLYILLPILGIYTLILYGYLAKIISIWQLPNGWVSWLVSVLGMVGYLLMFLLHPLYLQKNNKAATFFTRFFPIILFPLLVLMFIGIMRRFSDYGLTINRLYVLLLNLWLFGISIFLFISRSKQVKIIFISFATITLLSSVGIWSVFSVTKHSLKKELTQRLIEIGWFEQGKSFSNPVHLNTEKKERLHDIIVYLEKQYGKVAVFPYFKEVLGENASVYDFMKKLGVETNFEVEKFFSAYSKDDSYSSDVSDYKTFMYIVRRNNNEKVNVNESTVATIENNVLKITDTKNNTTLDISMNDMLFKIISNTEKSPLVDLTLTGTNYKLIILSIDGKRETNNTLTINYFSALLFLK